MQRVLALDPQVLLWSWQGRHLKQQGNVTQDRYNRTLRQRETYLQLQRENPNLIWLYNFLQDERIKLGKGDVVAAIRQVVMQGDEATPAVWRYIAHHRERDFRLLLDRYVPDGGYIGRWQVLVPWARVLILLGLNRTLPAAVAKGLFFHEGIRAYLDGDVKFRGGPIHIATLRTVVNEAIRRHHRGQLEDFLREDLVEVMTWLHSGGVELDRNQVRAGWRHLARQAVEWRVLAEYRDWSEVLNWQCILPTIQIGPWTVVPLTDAWSLRKEALVMRNCVDAYLPECVGGRKQIFSVRNCHDKPVATIGLEFNGEFWRVYDFRGFANSPIKGALQGLDQLVFQRHEDLYCLEAVHS